MKESTLNRMIREHKERYIWAAVFVILAVFVTALVFGTLRKSVLAQTYTNWELCMADGSDAQNGGVERICREYADKDRRIHYRKLGKISA